MNPTLLRTESEQLSDIFRALGEPLRLDIVRRMSAVHELPCNTLENELPISKSTISYHIKQLHHAGLIEIRKEGRYYFYRLRRDVMNYYLLRFAGDIGTEGPARPPLADVTRSRTTRTAVKRQEPKRRGKAV